MVVKPHLGTERSHDEVQFSFHPQVKTRKIVKVNEPSYDTKLNQFLSSNEVKTIQKKPASKVMKTSFVKKSSNASVVEITNPKVIKYEIQVGDRLDKISDKFYGTHHRWKDLVLANPGLNPEKIRPGQIILIPGLKTDLPKQDTVYLSAHQKNRRPYKIREKDLLGKIAERELGSVKYIPKILALNPGLDPNTIRPGQIINLPTSSSLR